MLHHAGGKLDAVYFPEEGMLSLVLNLADGGTAEVGVVGWEGMSAASLIVGVDRSYTECMVQIPGRALRMDAWIFARLMSEHASLREVLLRYTDTFTAQVTQTAACNGRHELDARLARWLLMAHDRARDTTIAVTQEFLAMMLGVRRPSVTITAGLLQQKRLIQQMNGRVVILDRPGLEAHSCECYEAAIQRYKTVMVAPPTV